MKKKLTWALILMFVLGIVGYAAGVGLSYVLDGAKGSLVDFLGKELALILLGVGAFIGIIIGVATKTKNKPGDNTGHTEDGEETEIAFDSKFISPEEMKNRWSFYFGTDMRSHHDSLCDQEEG